MTAPHRQERLIELFAEASELAQADRAPFLDRACGDDTELRAELETLLRTCRPISSEQALAFGLTREEVEGDLVDRAVELAHDMADGKAERSRMDEGPMANVPDTLPAVDIGHRSKKVDEILQKATLGAAKLPLQDAVPFEGKCFGVRHRGHAHRRRQLHAERPEGEGGVRAPVIGADLAVTR
ncbi:MAG: hypothetical protein ACE37K_22400 [Planctomycetota bacterium]